MGPFRACSLFSCHHFIALTGIDDLALLPDPGVPIALAIKICLYGRKGCNIIPFEGVAAGPELFEREYGPQEWTLFI